MKEKELRITHASVFSGIGGPEVAAAMLGWENLFHCEINPFGRAVLDYWFPKSKSYEDITKTDFSEWRGRVTVLTGGFPCQPFSYAGQRRGADDDRYLWPFMHRCINQVKPDWVVCENVAGITTMVEQGEVTEVASAPSLFNEEGDVHRYEYRATFTIERICHDLEADGYTVQPIVIPAAAVGAPHKRDRIFFVAHSESVGQFNGDWQGRYTVAGWPYMEAAERGVDASVSDGGEGLATDTEEQCRERMRLEQSEVGRASQIEFGRGSGEDCCGERWRYFPTVSPIHRGDDGFSFDVDDLTIPFTQWRTESLKAYGNAIVPQVMYEIFRTIEQVIKKEGAE